MVQLTDDQRVFVVTKYLETKSFKTVVDAFRLIYPNRNPPTKSTIWNNVQKYKNHSTSKNLNKETSGSHRTVRTQNNINQVRTLLQNQPDGTSCRRNFIGLSKSSFNRIVREDMKWHPFKIHVRQELLPTDLPRRLNFAQLFVNQSLNQRFLFNVVIGDEASFAMNGTVSTQNVRCYAPQGQSPDFFYDKKNSREKLSVWIGLCGNGAIIGPYFFLQNVNGRKYLDMLNNFAIPNIVQCYQNLQNVWWFQDGAPAHRTRVVIAQLTQSFQHRVVALNQPIEWPPRSPDLTPCDFFLWGWLKNKVYVTPPRNIADLRQRIVFHTNELKRNPNFVINSVRAMRTRANECINKNGGQVEPL